MNKKILLTGIICLGLLLAGCSAATSSVTSTQSSPNAASQTSGETLNANYDNALPVETQLAFGILKLDDSQYAVDSQTAAQLLPLWKAVRSLNTSDGAATEEIQAVYRQIEESMSAEQIQAIAAMQLTSADMSQMGQALGLSMGGAGGMSGTPDPTRQAAMQAAQGSGDAPPADFGGGMPGGDPGGMPVQGSNSQSASSSSTSATTNGASANPIVDAVISYLQSKLA